VRQRELTLYFVLAYGIAWIVWLPLVLGQNGLGWTHSKTEMFPWIPLGTIGPFAAALIAQVICCRNFHAFRLWTSLPRMFLGALVGMVCILVARWPLAGIGMTQSGFRAWDWAALLDFRHWFMPMLMAGPLGEEPGWRGFALPRMQSRWGPTRASILLGVLWAGWHLPLFLVQGWTTAPVWVFFVIVTGLSVIMTLGFNLSRGSVIVAMLLHDTHNSAGGPLYEMLAKATLRKHPGPDVFTACAFVVMGVALIVLTRGRLGLERSGAVRESA
jgi:CAAX protease family protein